MNSRWTRPAPLRWALVAVVLAHASNLCAAQTPPATEVGSLLTGDCVGLSACASAATRFVYNGLPPRSQKSSFSQVYQRPSLTGGEPQGSWEAPRTARTATHGLVSATRRRPCRHRPCPKRVRPHHPTGCRAPGQRLRGHQCGAMGLLHELGQSHTGRALRRLRAGL